jgi:ABC-2 type transport system ATP-binding protein
MAGVVARGLSKRYDSIQALDAVDLEVRRGEVRGLLGPNGAGKTTLLRLLLGLVRPDAGSVELLDGDFGLDGVAGFVEAPAFYPYLTGRANLELLAELDDAPREPVDEALARVGLTADAARRAGDYSTGMRQRLGLAAALVRSPRLLLLDEPTAGLDPDGVRLVWGVVRELAADSVAVLISSHQIGELEDVCDGFDVLSRGRRVWSGAAGEMRAQAPPSAWAMHTSDDARALALARDAAGVHALAEPGEDRLLLEAVPEALDAFVLALGRAGVAVRRLEQSASPLESMYFALTGSPR